MKSLLVTQFAYVVNQQYLINSFGYGKNGLKDMRISIGKYLRSTNLFSFTKTAGKIKETTWFNHEHC